MRIGNGRFGAMINMSRDPMGLWMIATVLALFLTGFELEYSNGRSK